MICCNKNIFAEASEGSGIDRQRLESLLGRGVQLGFAVEEWQRNSIWIVSRSDADYPARYKRHLKDKAPPLLFGVGDRSLLNGGGLSIVGSRNVDEEGGTFTRQVAELCAYNQMPVVSGCARGVDQIAMTAALEAGGVVIGILACNLLKQSLKRSARHAISDGRLLLLSSYHPKAHFTVGNAMGRNKLIYAMADYGLVVSAEHKKGGTWAGAEEELKRKISLPVFVRVGNNTPNGNNKLLALDAIPWPESIDKNNFKQQLLNLVVQVQEKQKTPGRFDLQYAQEAESTKEQQTTKESAYEEMPTIELKRKIQECPESLYEAALPVILSRLENPSTVKDLVETLGVNKTQLNAWLKKAVEENKLDKLSKLKPVCYQKPQSLFDIPRALEVESIKELQMAKKSIKKVPDVESKKKTQASSEFIYEAVLPVILSRLENPSTRRRAC